MQASHRLSEAAEILDSQPQALRLRYLEALTVIAADNNPTIVLSLPPAIIGLLLQVETRCSEARG